MGEMRGDAAGRMNYGHFNSAFVKTPVSLYNSASPETKSVEAKTDEQLITGISVSSKRPCGPCRQPRQTRRRLCKWKKKEDELLREGVKLYGVSHWSKIAQHVGTRNNKMCAQRWQFSLRPELRVVKKGTWTNQEDDQLRELVRLHGCKGAKTWETISEGMNWRRNSKQCRERCENFLDPTLRFDPWTIQEDQRLMSLYDRFSNSWRKFTDSLPGRTPERVRRRYAWLLK